VYIQQVESPSEIVVLPELYLLEQYQKNVVKQTACRCSVKAVCLAGSICLNLKSDLGFLS